MRKVALVQVAPVLTRRWNSFSATLAMIASLQVWDEGRRFSSVKLSQPTQISSFSKDADGSVHCPAPPQALRRFHAPRIGSNLAEGFDTFVPKKTDEDGKKTTNLVPVIAAMKDAGYGRGVNFVSFRNNLNKIMETPYNKRDEWRIDMHRVDGTIYLNVVRLDEQGFMGQERLMYYGYKFEELCTRGDGGASSVDANVEFCSVFKLSIGDSKVVLGAEIDCYDGEEGEGSKAPHSKYVEIKTSKAIEHGGQRKTFEKKLLKYWIQSFLAGVPSIVVGFRDDNAGLLKQVERYKTLELPRFVRGKQDGWDPQVCINFTALVLDMLRDKTEDGGQYSLRYMHPFTHVRLEKLHTGDHDSFLPPEYRI